MKNEEECSFTLTEDDDRDFDGNPNRRSSMLRRQRQKSDPSMLIQDLSSQAPPNMETVNEEH